MCSGEGQVPGKSGEGCALGGEASAGCQAAAEAVMGQLIVRLYRTVGWAGLTLIGMFAGVLMASLILIILPEASLPLWALLIPAALFLVAWTVPDD